MPSNKNSNFLTHLATHKDIEVLYKRTAAPAQSALGSLPYPTDCRLTKCELYSASFSLLAQSIKSSNSMIPIKLAAQTTFSNKTSYLSPTEDASTDFQKVIIDYISTEQVTNNIFFAP